MGKEKLRQEQLTNLQLKINGEAIELLPTAEETNNYSIKNTLAELYIAKNYELGKDFSSEIVDYYNSVKSIFGNGKKEFSDELIAGIARDKIQFDSTRLPVPIDSRVGVKKQTEQLRMENMRLQNQNSQKEANARDNFRIKTRVRTNYENNIINSLSDISYSIQNNPYYESNDRANEDKEQPNKMEDTVELFGQN